ncbi:MAG: uL15 family ribosomal protein [Patescibacteria group bacterium]
MQLHDLKRKTKNKKHVQVGRGGKRGKTSGRGTKGQKARAGRKIRPEIRDTIKKLPKLRGYAFNTIETKPMAITITKIEKAFPDGGDINSTSLLASKLLSSYKGKTPKVKILGGKGEAAISKKYNLSGVIVSASVRAAIEKAGGKVE